MNDMGSCQNFHGRIPGLKLSALLGSIFDEIIEINAIKTENMGKLYILQILKEQCLCPQRTK